MNQPRIKFKTASDVPVNDYLAILDGLRGVLGDTDGPRLIDDLLLWCQEGRAGVPQATVDFFTPCVTIIDRKTGNPLPHVREVLKAAYRRTLDGVCLVDAHSPTDENESTIKAYRQSQQRMLMRELGLTGKPARGEAAPRRRK